jgi:hypothetical protein
MSAIVYIGPTLPANEVRSMFPSVTVAAPISCGELYALAKQRQRPKRVLIVDGYFERMAAVWHKEILFALERGIVVYGAASMGALRAAELAPMGMIGIGRIFRDYASGRRSADDEVAVAHLPAEFNYRSNSDALVNIRATLRRAEKHRVINVKQSRDILAVAKSTHYRERRWSALIENASADFRRWLPSNFVDQKAVDARAALRAVEYPSVAIEAKAGLLVRPMPRTWAMSVLDDLVTTAISRSNT